MADKAPDPEALEKEIERTREELARTIDEIVDRVNPRNVAQRGVTRLKEETGQVIAAVGALVAPPGETDGEAGPVDRRVIAVGVGAVVVVTAFMLWRRGRRRRR
ncbi:MULTISPECIES: DUF3618 domain-containing protein [Thermomonospora]|uniref:DUF3618 domain-containing protein n=1 Tax=Thermomonospora curvata (strain ATCC 19995 / DSM 43183 / JCM 3096 / KCTC 9072 / NBRC 15933 / NCIMB 10081 / Henssen B9) TaxID=471852 RepID=D1AD80_THECD|nr:MULTISPECIES: DUF3618 domain-containing protein [Thermomonospora]ACY99389.1 hypothetical protein Tcur_3860 [Thermomonospora curvata DSM 43183]PKK12437.1 MAG: DUF3618 domain-containing protein [Thermomonospora sp. CIF 1]